MLTAGAIVTLELGHYRLREQIAGSAYGVVWRASGPRATQDVALKLINQQQMALALPQQRARWVASASNEIAFLESLEPWDERHIVRLLDSGMHERLPVLALELMACDLGQHVAALRQAGRSLSLVQVLDWVGQINQALAKVHQYGWRYLDLKPANVLLDRHLNTVKLADFGTNRVRDDLNAHSYAGTANWQAPEQFFPARPGGGYATGMRSDYFALGALFYFLVSGGLPLRFCSDCGQAYREHHTGGADVLRRRSGGAIPATLQADEEASFGRRIEDAMDAVRAGLGDPAWRPAPSAYGGCAEAALKLLRALLAPDPDQRPGHAIQISRMLASVRAALMGPQRVALSELVRVVGRPSAQNGWPALGDA
ncbi:MAG TPA: protein kinase [Janthinobacterium sp.]|jgi:serine/threonine-protein kinase|nr:protein kinase [Janthinobacterium sp.]